MKLTLYFVLVAVFLVTIGHLTSNQGLVQILPFSAPMQPNTAVCFALLAVGYLFIERPKISFGSFALCLIFAGATLGQDVMGISIGLDGILFETANKTKALVPGRMSPLTAISFVSASLAGILLRGKRSLNGFLSSLLLAGNIAMACTALTSYAFGLRQTIDQYLQLMSVLTCINHLLIAVFGYSLVRRAIENQRETVAIWYGFTSGFIVFVFTLSFWLLLRFVHHESQIHSIKTAVNAMAGAIERETLRTLDSAFAIAALASKPGQRVPQIPSTADRGAPMEMAFLSRDLIAGVTHCSAIPTDTISLGRVIKFEVFIGR